MSLSLIKYTQENKHRMDSDNTCHYYFLTNKKFAEHLNDICFARFTQSWEDSRILNKPTKFIKGRMFVNQIDGKFVKKENRKLVKQHIEWVVKHSAFSNAFLNRNGNWWNEGLALNPKCTHKFLFTAMTMVRIAYEYDEFNYVKIVNWLVTLGFKKQEACYVAAYLYWGKDFDVEKPCQIYHYASGHGIADLNASPKNLVNAATILSEGKPAKEEFKSFYGVFVKLADRRTCVENILLKDGKEVGGGWDSKYVITKEQLLLNLNSLKEAMYE